jgi:hypothetical protein
MSSVRTQVTEIVTGLGMLGHLDLDHALSVRPRVVRNVERAHFDRLDEARASGAFDREFATAWGNGVVFATAAEGLRGRPPWTLEWKGPHKPPGYEQIPADLRVDHVYLISCKYGSTILHNTSPSQLLDHRLADRRAERIADWFSEVAPEAHQELYAACREELGEQALPDRVHDLTNEHRVLLKALPRQWSASLEDVYRDFARAVSLASAQRWLSSLRGAGPREEMVWRLLRLQAAPYFVLGAGSDGAPWRYRVGTPWDFRERFEFRHFDAWADAVGQPVVRWRADVRDRQSDQLRHIDGYVEIRWTHGRFSGAPEAKVHLTSSPHDVPGYWPLA